MKNNLTLSFTEPPHYFCSGLGSVFVGVFLLLCGTVAPVVAQEDPMYEAAGSFLELLDAGSYQQAWWEGSELLHLISDPDSWVEEVRIQREIFGVFDERSIRTVASRKNVSGLPDGDYGILLFDSRFENKKNGLEMMTIGKDPYGDWKVVSYRLR